MIATFEVYLRRGGKATAIANTWGRERANVYKLAKQYPHHFMVEFDPKNPETPQRAWIKKMMVHKQERVLFDHTEKVADVRENI